MYDFFVCNLTLFRWLGSFIRPIWNDSVHSSLDPFSFQFELINILGDPGPDKGGEGKSKGAEKYIWNEEK